MFQSKLIKSGPVLEVYTYSLPDEKYGIKKSWEEDSCDESENDQFGSFYRSKRNAKRIIFSNAWRWYKKNGSPFPPFFLTLTFEDNIQDLKLANRMFSKFIQRFNYKLTNKKKAYLQYLGVIEFQRRGAIHYHVIIFNLPYIKDMVYKTMRELWGQGRIELKIVKSINTLINYLSKYMVKDIENGKLSEKKRYFTSRKIKRPLVSYDFYATLLLSSNLKNRLILEKEMDIKYIGHMKYQKYMLYPEDEDILYLDYPILDRKTKKNVLSLTKENNLKLPL